MIKRLFLAVILIFSLSFALLSCNSEDSGSEGGDGDVVDNVGGENGNNGGADNSDSSNDGEKGDGGLTDSESGGEKSEGDEGNSESTDEIGGETNPEVKYVYSVNSKKYHLPTCYHTKNIGSATKIEFCGTIDELSAAGYLPCKSCKPDPSFDYEISADDVEDGDDTVPEYKYILNPASHKFHLYGCASAGAMKEENKQYSNESRDELINQEYSPCGNCNP